jgi:hypothetical protein
LTDIQSTSADSAKVVTVRIFVPVEDAPSGVQTAPLVPYQCGLACEHALRRAQLSEMWAQFAMMDAGWNRQHEQAAADQDGSSPVLE